jgi:hypothetical protein
LPASQPKQTFYSDEELVSKVWNEHRNPDFPRNRKNLAKYLKTTEPRLRRLFTRGIPGLPPRLILVDAEIILNKAIDYIKITENPSLGSFCKIYGFSKRSVKKAVSDDIYKKLLSKSYLNSALKKTPVGSASAKRLNKLLKILEYHTNQQRITKGFLPLKIKDISLQCQICGVNSDTDKNIERILTIDHVFGRKFNKIKFLRVICACCHRFTFNHKRSNLSIPVCYISEPPINGYDITKINHCVGGSLPPEFKKYINYRLGRMGLSNSNTTLENVKPWKNIKPGNNTGKFLESLISTKTKKPLCELCNKTYHCGVSNISFLELHHKDGDFRNNELTNIMILCANCHMTQHVLPALVQRGNDGWYSLNKFIYRNANQVYEHEAKWAEQNHFLLDQIGKSDSPEVRLVQKGDPRTYDFRLIYALLTNVDRPRSMNACAKFLKISKDRFKKTVFTFWPSLWQPLNEGPRNSNPLDISLLNVPTLMPPSDNPL